MKASTVFNLGILIMFVSFLYANDDEHALRIEKEIEQLRIEARELKKSIKNQENYDVPSLDEGLESGLYVNVREKDILSLKKEARELKKSIKNQENYDVPSLNEGFESGVYVNRKEKLIENLERLRLEARELKKNIKNKEEYEVPSIHEGFEKGLYVDIKKQGNKNVQKKPFQEKVLKEDKAQELLVVDDKVNIDSYLNVKKEFPKNLKKEEKKNSKSSINQETKKWGFNVFSGVSKITSYNRSAFLSTYTDEDIDSSGTILGFGLDYNFHTNWFASLSYQRISLSNELIINYLVDYNYQFNQIAKFKPYIGLVSGISYIDVESVGISSLNGVDKKGNDFIYGIQIGSKYQINDNVYINILYQRLDMSHVTYLILSDREGKVTRDDLDNIYLGLRYNFNLF